MVTLLLATNIKVVAALILAASISTVVLLWCLQESDLLLYILVSIILFLHLYLNQQLSIIYYFLIIMTLYNDSFTDQIWNLNNVIILCVQYQVLFYSVPAG